MSQLPAIQTISLSPEQFKMIEDMAAVNFSISQIATLIEVDKRLLKTEWQDPKSLVRYHYDKGLLASEYNINKELKDSAIGGNVTSAQVFKKFRDDRLFENHRNRILNE